MEHCLHTAPSIPNSIRKALIKSISYTARHAAACALVDNDARGKWRSNNVKNTVQSTVYALRLSVMALFTWLRAPSTSSAWAFVHLNQASRDQQRREIIAAEEIRNQMCFMTCRLLAVPCKVAGEDAFPSASWSSTLSCSSRPGSNVRSPKTSVRLCISSHGVPDNGFVLDVTEAGIMPTRGRRISDDLLHSCINMEEEIY